MSSASLLANEFCYCENDFVKDLSDNDSPFDNLLKEKWLQAQHNNAFRYDFTEKSDDTKILPGTYQFVVHYNEKRGLLRRKPQETTSLVMPFDKDKFNFTKINPIEILFNIKNKDNQEETTIIINSSPFSFCNSLMVPYLNKCRPQVFTCDSLRMAIHIIALNSDGKLKAGFNSLGAMASVNHQHWHIYYYNHPLLIETFPIKDNLLYNWPVHVIVYEMNKLTNQEINKIVDKVDVLMNFCIKENVAHNLYVARNKFGIIRVFAWLRDSVFGIKDDMEINPALCEFVGFFICKTKKLFDTIDEKYCIDLLKSVDKVDAYLKFQSLPYKINT